MTRISALLVIDLQVGVLVDCLDAQTVVERAAELVERARASGVPVIWVQDHGDFAEGTDEWNLASPLARTATEPLVKKSYRDSFADTDLAELLASRRVERLVVAGAQSDYCIRTTIQSAAVKGFDVTLVGDAHTTTDAEWDGVTIPAAQIVAHTNMYFSGLRYPGLAFAVEPHHQVRLLA